MSQWHAPPSPQKTTTTKNQSTLPIKHTTRARTTQIIYAQVQKCTAHSVQQTLTQSFQHANVEPKSQLQQDLKEPSLSWGFFLMHMYVEDES